MNKKIAELNKTIMDVFAEAKKSGEVLSDEYSKRLAVCRECPRYDTQWNQCLECGCFMFVKARLKAAQCPLSKWGNLNG